VKKEPEFATPPVNPMRGGSGSRQQQRHADDTLLIPKQR
jgi:hypothetical protein